MVPGCVVSHNPTLKSLDSGEPWINFKKKTTKVAFRLKLHLFQIRLNSKRFY